MYMTVIMLLMKLPYVQLKLYTFVTSKMESLEVSSAQTLLDCSHM